MRATRIWVYSSLRYEMMQLGYGLEEGRWGGVKCYFRFDFGLGLGLGLGLVVSHPNVACCHNKSITEHNRKLEYGIDPFIENEATALNHRI